MRRVRIDLLALCVGLALGRAHADAQVTPDRTVSVATSAEDEGRGQPAQLAAGRAAYFASNQLTSTRLLHLRPDGTFAEYDREHMYIAVSDEGRWRQTAAGEIELCSHYRFEPIRTGDLSVYMNADDAAGLPALAAAIEERLSTLPGKTDLEARQLMPVVLRSWGEKDAFAPLPAGGLAPNIMSDKKRVTRDDLRALATAIRERVAKRNGNLSTFLVRRYGDLLWLSGDGAPLGKEVVEQLRQHKEGPFLPWAITAAVDASAFASLLGTRQSFLYYPEMNARIPRRDLIHDFRRARVAEPQCGAFTAGAEALPESPTAEAATLPEGEEVGFVAEGGSGTDLLILGADRHFQRYERQDDKAQLAGAGEWGRRADGVVQLCSPSAFRPIGQERLQLSVDEATYARLPALLAGLRAHLDANPKKVSFSPKSLERVATRALPTAGSEAKGCSCQRLVYGKEPIPREKVLAFVAALDEYLRSGTANLFEYRAWSFGATTWLGPSDGQITADVVRTLKALGDDPCVLPDVLVRVPTRTVEELRGPTPEAQKPLARSAPPLCAGFAP